MCRKCFNRYNCRERGCNRCCSYNNCCYDSRCEDFLLPIMFWMVRDATRCCRCNFVNRYDRYRY